MLEMAFSKVFSYLHCKTISKDIFKTLTVFPLLDADIH